jgi:hypothetical protein
MIKLDQVNIHGKMFLHKIKKKVVFLIIEKGSGWSKYKE